MWCAGSGWSFNPIIYSIPTNGSWEESPSSTLFAKRSFMLNFSKYFFPVQVLVLLVKIYCFHFVPLWNTLPCHRKDFFLGHSKQSPSTHRGSKPWWYGDSVGAAYGWRQACWGSHSWRWGPTSGREGPFKKVDLECHKRKNNTSYMNFLMNTYLHSGRLRHAPHNAGPFWVWINCHGIWWKKHCNIYTSRVVWENNVFLIFQRVQEAFPMNNYKTCSHALTP